MIIGLCNVLLKGCFKKSKENSIILKNKNGKNQALFLVLFFLIKFVFDCSLTHYSGKRPTWILYR